MKVYVKTEGFFFFVFQGLHNIGANWNKQRGCYSFKQESVVSYVVNMVMIKLHVNGVQHTSHSVLFAQTKCNSCDIRSAPCLLMTVIMRRICNRQFTVYHF